MAYATGVASGPDDFITQLCAFAVANAGFTSQGTVTSSAGSGSRTVRRVSKGGVWWSFFRFSDNKGMAGYMGYSGIAAGDTLPATRSDDKQTYPTCMGTWDFTGPYVGHYFFTDGTCVHAVLEVSAGIFNHMSFGAVAQLGTWSGGWAGGEYITGGYSQTYKPSNVWEDSFSLYCTLPFHDHWQANMGTTVSSTYIRAANTGVGSNFVQVLGAHDAQNGHGMFVGLYDSGDYQGGSLYQRLIRDAHNETTNRTPILPGLVRLRDGASGLCHLAGSIPYVGFMKMTPDMNPKDIINTDWQIFPIAMRTGGNRALAALSFEYALAYRRVA